MKTHKEPKKKDYKDGEITKLKRRINKLIKENSRLKSELNTLEQAFKRTGRYIDNNLDGVSVDKVIRGVEKENKMKKIVEENTCPECGSKDLYESEGLYGHLVGCRKCTYRKITR